jgi:hypothetical protein
MNLVKIPKGKFLPALSVRRSSPDCKFLVFENTDFTRLSAIRAENPIE